MPKMTPIDERHSPWAWAAREMAERDDWCLQLSETHIAEIEQATIHLKRRATPLEAIQAIDFPLGQLSSLLKEISLLLSDGPGVALLRGLPLTSYTNSDIERIFCGLGAHLGTSVSQSHRGDRLGRVMDIGEGGRYYTVGGALEMHMDPADVVGLLCLRPAITGGESRVASAIAVHDTIEAERPDLMTILKDGFFYSSSNQDRVDGDIPVSEQRIPVFAPVAGKLTCFYLPISVRGAESHGRTLSAVEREALEFVNEVASRPNHCFEMNLLPGDIQFLNNRHILHGRSDYTDATTRAQKREMLRLWLMINHWAPRPPNWNFHGVSDRAAGGIPPRT